MCTILCSQVPARLHASTPVHLMATAGLRLLPAEDAAGILDACSKVMAASGFLFKPNHTLLLPGELEGLYSWVAVNYVNGNLQVSFPPHSMDDLGKVDGLVVCNRQRFGQLTS
jgi:Golgi nucleoside diphosphatase